MTAKVRLGWGEDELTAPELATRLEDAGISGLKDEAVGEMTMDELEKEVIEKYLIKFKNNRRQTANALNISERIYIEN